jgi:hypothetical protein
MRLVAATRQLDVDRVCQTIGLIIKVKLFTQPTSLDANEGIGVGVERIGAAEDFKSDGIAL